MVDFCGRGRPVHGAFFLGHSEDPVKAPSQVPQRWRRTALHLLYALPPAAARDPAHRSRAVLFRDARRSRGCRCGASVAIASATSRPGETLDGLGGFPSYSSARTTT